MHLHFLIVSLQSLHSLQSGQWFKLIRCAGYSQSTQTKTPVALRALTLEVALFLVVLLLVFFFI